MCSLDSPAEKQPSASQPNQFGDAQRSTVPMTNASVWPRAQPSVAAPWDSRSDRTAANENFIRSCEWLLFYVCRKAKGSAYPRELSRLLAVYARASESGGPGPGDDAHQARAWVSGALTDYEFWSGIIYLRHNRLVGSVVEAIGNKYSPARLDPLCCRLASHVPEQPATPRATL